MRLTTLPVLLSLLLTLPTPAQEKLFARDNLVAWCIVPFDVKKRSPEERAAMMEKMGIRRFAYDWRAQHLPTLEEEIAALKKHKVELTAFWLPAGTSEKDKRFVLDLFKKHDLKPQLWVMASPKVDADPAKTIASAMDQLRPLVKEAAALGCPVALYNHGGWFGQPDNQIAIIERLKAEGLSNVGIVYNLHHGHEHLAKFSELLAKMKPHLLCLNLNGMTAGGDKTGKKIMPIAQGDLDLALLKTVRDSGYTGLIGVLNHTDADAEARLLDNIDGLEYLAAALDGKVPASKPTPRSWKPAP